MQGTIRVQNIMALASTGQKLDLKHIAGHIPDAVYTDDFPGMRYRIHELNSSVLLFRSGNIVCAGAKSEEQVHRVYGHICDVLRRLGYDVQQPNITTTNIVATANIGRGLSMQYVSDLLPGARYEPEMYAGVTYHAEKKVVARIHASGKIIFVGARAMQDIVDAYNDIRALLA